MAYTVMGDMVAALDEINVDLYAKGDGIRTTTIEYQVGDSGTIAPTGNWSSEIPTIQQGKYLWTRTTYVYTNGESLESYNVSYQARDGLINGFNNVTIQQGNNVTITQNENIVTISSSDDSKADKNAAARYLTASIDTTTYVMTLSIKDLNNNILSTQTIDLPLKSMVVSGSYDDNIKKIILTLQSGSIVEFSVADLVSGLQSEITSNNKLSSDLVDDTGHTNLFVTTSEKTAWNAKYGIPSGGIPSTDLASAVQTSLGKADTAVQNVDYATNSTGGVIKTKGDYGTGISSAGELRASTKTYSQYEDLTDYLFISKGTLENVLTGKNLETTNNKVTSLSSLSTDTQYPSAKCVYDSFANFNNFEVYSTSEVVCGTWIDGRPVYRVVTYIDSLPNAGQKGYSCNVSSDADMAINVYGAASNGMLLNAIRTNGINMCIGAWYDVPENKIKIETGTDRHSLSAYVVVEYTKSTDLNPSI